MNRVTILIPTYNEAKRLNFDFISRLLETDKSIHIIFIDDGSRDSTVNMIERFIVKKESKNLSLISLPKNVGKANAIRTGFQTILMQKSVIESNRNVSVLLVDADCPIGYSDLTRFMKLASMEKTVAILSGARVRLAGHQVSRPLVRQWLGRLIATLVSFLLRETIYDPQSPCKVFNLRYLDMSLFGEPFQTKWFGEAELIHRIRKWNDPYPDDFLLLKEEPLYEWQDVEGSHLRLTSALEVLKDLLKLKRQINK